MEPHLLEAYGFIVWADLPSGPIGSPTRSSEKPAESVVGRIHPAARPDKPISAQRVRAGVQQPRSMALMLGRRIHHELINRALGTSGPHPRPGWAWWSRIPTTRWPSVATRTRNVASGRLLDRLTPGVDHVRQRYRR